MKLCSTTDYIHYLVNKKITASEVANKAVNYANFLKQPLKLSMFVPCDDDGKVLFKGFKLENGKLYKNGVESGFEVTESGKIQFDEYELYNLSVVEDLIGFDNTIELVYSVEIEFN